MSCGYACVNCGKCKGEVRPALAAGLCPACGAENDPEASRCAQCGMLLPPKAGEKKGLGCS